MDALPPSSELFNKHQLVARHPHLFSDSRVAWMIRNRKNNGLAAVGGVFESRGGEILIHEPSAIRWFLGLAGRAKPRALRRRGRGRS